MATTSYGSMTSNRIDRKASGSKRFPGGAKKVQKVKK